MSFINKNHKTLMLTKENHDRVATISSMLYMSEDRLINELLDAVLNEDKGMHKDIEKLCNSKIPQINNKINAVKSYEQPAYFAVLSRYNFMKKVLDPESARSQFEKELLKVKDAYNKIIDGTAATDDKMLFLTAYIDYSKMGCTWLVERLLDKDKVSEKEVNDFQQLIEDTANEVFG